ncbi:MAG: bifunctional isocitrate dehydrogenase kinase/phosphatase [Pseudomonadota bacterium]
MARANNVRRLARVILNGFNAYFSDFQNITLGAQSRFERADWGAVQESGHLRLALYKRKVIGVAEASTSLVGENVLKSELWHEAKQEYADIVQSHQNYEIAQTFFNSVYGYLFKHRKIQDFHAFVFALENKALDLDVNNEEISTIYPVGGTIKKLLERMFDDFEFNVPFENRERDINRLFDASVELIIPSFSEHEVIHLETLNSLFFRNKGAYLIGRVVSETTGVQKPFVVVFLNNEQGAVYVDTLLVRPKDLSILFSFSRSYFMVDSTVPSQYVRFLIDLMPNKEMFEMYNSLGHDRHGKTEFYRSAVAHTRETPKEEQYIIAPGIPGMVMLVFTLPSYNYVYKIIKDKFTPPKSMTRQEVKEKYELVKRWDRVGRMADTQEFHNLAFKRSRFSDELLAELREKAPSILEESDRGIVLKHVYIERKMVPLNMYLADASDDDIESAMDEYGNAIKQLAAANIFPGDMLLKNFGVTRHNRVVFYDYDEVCPLVDCNFREIPEPKNAFQEEQEMAGDLWYSVADEDVFPEEFRLFFSGNRKAQQSFEEKHADLYEANFWSGLQKDILEGRVADVFPYRRKIRFPRED